MAGRVIFDKISDFFQLLAIDGFGQTNVERSVFPVVKFFGQFQAVGLVFLADKFLAFSDSLLEKLELLADRLGRIGTGHGLLY